MRYIIYLLMVKDSNNTINTLLSIMISALQKSSSFQSLGKECTLRLH